MISGSVVVPFQKGPYFCRATRDERLGFLLPLLEAAVVGRVLLYSFFFGPPPLFFAPFHNTKVNKQNEKVKYCENERSKEEAMALLWMDQEWRRPRRGASGTSRSLEISTTLLCYHLYFVNLFILSFFLFLFFVWPRYFFCVGRPDLHWFKSPLFVILLRSFTQQLQVI